MIVTIEPKPEVEERAMAEAGALGLPVERYLQSVIEICLVRAEGGPAAHNSTPAERGRVWTEWARSHSRDAPAVLNDDREFIYGNDGR
jgi:hypothetical protein